jgi:hypothetical protein
MLELQVRIGECRFSRFDLKMHMELVNVVDAERRKVLLVAANVSFCSGRLPIVTINLI